MPSDNIIQPLVELGLTGLEAEVYVHLLECSPCTGYAVAKGTGKPTANTYKALEALLEKGAVEVDDDGKRAYRAVPADELLETLGRRFAERRHRAAERLAQVKPAGGDERVYRLRTPAQVVERARQMLARAEVVAVLDLFPWPASQLEEDIAAAARRGIRVAAKVYQPIELPGADVVLDGHGAAVMSRWPGQWANAVVDGREHLLALLSSDGNTVRQAVWSESAFLSWVYHGALISELLYAAVEQGLSEGLSTDELEMTFENYRSLRSENAPGYRELIGRLTETEQPTR